MYLRLQLILFIGIIFSTTEIIEGIIDPTSGIIKLSHIFNTLSLKNLPRSLDIIHNCIANSNLNPTIEIKKEKINPFLTKLRGDIVSSKINPNTISTSIFEFLKLDEKYITEEFNECCIDFHLNLFTVEESKLNNTTESLTKMVDLRFTEAFKIMYGCLKEYKSLDNAVKKRYGIRRQSKNNQKSKIERVHKLKQHTIDVMSPNKNYTSQYIVNSLEEHIHGKHNHTNLFAKPCTAAYYSYLVFNDYAMR
ncbi:uncharacterized protein LOC126908642 [Daktulosphaira vitifoliae]|uniref:uncharacterized protein LOC126908642 n=1 Tax=Daktulosphaira vitifoliae TaxID=58002 RepID=UPI0021AA9492|nr:uncharacterized protein LOC126908642 [Daktulosphaira vitifoliae]XP_050546861.1 uncharacterized protein LOC126908642 [Daktulosphaira vitifoliae]